MSQPRPLVDRTIALRVLRWQVIAGLSIAGIAAVFSLQAGLSAGLGAGIAVAGSLYFALQAFRHAGAASAQRIVQGFYKGEAGKFVITALLFAVVFITCKWVMPGWLFTGFILEQLVLWLLPLLAATKGER